MMGKQSLSSVENGPVNDAEWFWQSNGLGEHPCISPLWVAPLIFGRSLYDPTSKQLIKVTGLSRQRGTLCGNECNGTSDIGRIWRSSKRTQSDLLYLTFTFCPLLPRSWSEVTLITR